MLGKAVIAVGAILGLLNTGPAAAANALIAIARLDVPRYMGTWYEITKYPQLVPEKVRFGHQCRLQPPTRRQRQGLQPLQDGGRHLGRGHRSGSADRPFAGHHVTSRDGRS